MAGYTWTSFLVLVCPFLFPDEGYGFLKTEEGNEIYFHKNSVPNETFNRLTLGSKVTFIEEKGEKRVQASTVRCCIEW